VRVDHGERALPDGPGRTEDRNLFHLITSTTECTEHTETIGLPNSHFHSYVVSAFRRTCSRSG
jgi:hypothetical protein